MGEVDYALCNYCLIFGLFQWYIGRTYNPPTRAAARRPSLALPFSPLCCVEGLSKSIISATENGTLSGCKISPSAPAVTHLLFADDSFLFFKASREQAVVVKELLNKYESLSGQSINLQKSGIMFSSNVRLDKQAELTSILGVSNDLRTSNYLGLPSLIGRAKKSVFNFLKERFGREFRVGVQSFCQKRVRQCFFVMLHKRSLHIA